MSRQTRLAFNRLMASAADFMRNLGLLFVAAPLVDPLINPTRTVPLGALIAAIAVGLALLSIALILAWFQKE